jgi:hypothetical protein
MAVEETLLNVSIIVIPVWLGIVRYMIHDYEFNSEPSANVASALIPSIFILLIYAMWIPVDSMAASNPSMSAGLYALFTAISLTGSGGVVLILIEIEYWSSGFVIGTSAVTIIGIISGILFDPFQNFQSMLSIAIIVVFILIFLGMMYHKEHRL